MGIMWHIQVLFKARCFCCMRRQLEIILRFDSSERRPKDT